MGIGDIISGVSDLIGIFRRSNSSGYSYSSLTSPPKTRQNKRKKKTSAASSNSPQHHLPPAPQKPSIQPLWQKKEDYDKKALRLIVNCLKRLKLDRAELAVTKLQNQHPYKAPRELARILIVKKTFALAQVPLDSIDPGAFPDKSSKEILEGMEAVTINRLVKFSVEMIYQLALIYGLPFRYENWEVEVISVFYAALLGDVAIQQGIDWLKSGNNLENIYPSEIKALIVYAIGETACLFYEDIYSHGSNPFKKAKAFNRISRKAQNYLRPFNSKSKIKKLVSKEIGKAFPIEYDKLCDLLESKSWKEADQETLNIVLKLMRRKKLKLCEAGLLLANAKASPLVWILKLDYEDLEILNSVWLKNSDGHFGFAVQSQIYMQNQSIEDFYQSVGWIANSELKSLEELTFDLDSPKGHLPGFWLYSNFTAEPDSTIADWLTFFLKYVSTLPVKVIGIDAAESTTVSSDELSPNVNGDID